MCECVCGVCVCWVGGIEEEYIFDYGTVLIGKESYYVEKRRDSVYK